MKILAVGLPRTERRSRRRACARRSRRSRREDPGGIRGKAARKEVEERKEQEAAAVKIQAVHRGKAARKEVEERKEQEAAAVKIQAVHRGKAARKEVEERKEQEAAAVKIQAVHRGKAARKEVEERKEQEAAAVKIQAVHRGKAARKEVEERKEQEAAAVKILRGGAPGQGGAQGGRGAQGAGGCRREDPGGAQGQGGAQGGRGAQGAGSCAVKIQAVHRGKAARKEVEERKEQEAAAVKIGRCTGATALQGSLRSPSVEAFLPLDGSPFLFIDATDADDSKAFEESLVTSSPSRASAPSTSESRVSASCKKLGIDPAAVAAQLAAFPAPQIEIPLRSGVPPPDTPALACLLLLENRQMSFRVRSEFELRDLRLATEFAEASAALKLPAGAAALVTFKRKGEALVRAVRRRAIRDGLLRPTARDEKRLEAMRAESFAAKPTRR